MQTPENQPARGTPTETTMQESGIAQLTNEYRQACFNLAIAMEKIHRAYSRHMLEDVTDFDVARITWFINIARVYDPSFRNLLPEHFIEVHGLETKAAKKFLGIANTKKLKPLQLRKLIRSCSKTVNSRNIQTQFQGFGKNLMLLENELKGMNPEQRQRALAQLTNSILSINERR